MYKDLFDDNITPACEYCSFGTASADPSKILCMKKGVMPPEFACRLFQYEPLKRKPRKPIQQSFDKNDFSL